MKKLLLFIVIFIGVTSYTFAQIRTTQKVNQISLPSSFEVVKIKAKLHSYRLPQELIVSKINNRYYFEGDIEIPKEIIVNEIRITLPQLKIIIKEGRVNRSLARKNGPFLIDEYRWPQGVIPYEIDSSIPGLQISEIEDAIEHINQNSNLCIRERNGEYDFVNIVWNPNLGFNGGASAVGNIPIIGKQDLSLFSSSGIISKGTIIHELLHAAGFFHEQSRSDRDDYIRINWKNIQTGFEFNFAQHITDGIDLNNYDYESIMHYGKTSFSRRNADGGIIGNTIDCINNGGDPCSIGQRGGLSKGDIKGVNQIYPTKNCAHPNVDFTLEADKYYKVKHVRTGKYLGNMTGGATNNEMVSLSPYNLYKKWKLVRISGSLNTYFIVLCGNNGNRRILEAGFHDEKIQLWERQIPSFLTKNQHWKVKQLHDGNFTIKNVKFNKYLYVKNDGTLILNNPGKYKKYYWKIE